VDLASHEVDAWAWVEDYYDEGSCFWESYQYWYYWEHWYHASVNIVSPTQNSSYDEDNQGTFAYGGGSAQVFASLSFDEDFGDYIIEVILRIYCNIGGLFVDDFVGYNIPFFACNADGVTAAAIIAMNWWTPLAWERGGTIGCVGGIAFPTNWMDSFGQVFSAWYYTPTMDPCRLTFEPWMSQSAFGGFHSHPDFVSNAQLNEGVRCHGAEEPYDFSSSEISAANNYNNTFQGSFWGSNQGGDYAWPPGTGTPFYLLVPDADRIKMLDTNLDVDTVWEQ
jgi:hypothetical protein